jgi:hypothetical protein
MKKNRIFEIILIEFEKWYSKDEHKVNIDFYNDFFTMENIEMLSDEGLIDFFYEFIADGGKVQSGGNRTKNRFRVEVEDKLQAFKSFILEPFNEKFILSDWFNRINNFKYFGIGIATIYLNRIDKERYSIMNNKTLKALIKLGYNISLTESFANYEKVNEIQNKLISDYPRLSNLYVIDALNHFVVAVDKGKELMIEYSDIIEFGNLTEQNEIIKDEKSNNEDLNN